MMVGAGNIFKLRYTNLLSEQSIQWEKVNSGFLRVAIMRGELIRSSEAEIKMSERLTKFD